MTAILIIAIAAFLACCLVVGMACAYAAGESDRDIERARHGWGE